MIFVPFFIIRMTILILIIRIIAIYTNCITKVSAIITIRAFVIIICKWS